MIQVGLTLMALAGAVIAAYAVIVAFSGDDGQTTVGLTDWEPTDTHCDPDCTCRGAGPWSM